MLVKLSHIEPTIELWIDTSEIVVMERKNKPKSIIITQNMDEPDITIIVLKNGRQFGCVETPQQILDKASKT